MNVNGNNLPRSTMGLNAQNLQNLQKTDKSELVGEAQQANTDRPEGETIIDKTIIVNRKDDGYYVTYDGDDNGVIVFLRDGKLSTVAFDEKMHNEIRDGGEGLHPYPTEE